jgi:hypothetical protein
MTDKSALVRWQQAAGRWGHFIKPALLAVSPADASRHRPETAAWPGIPSDPTAAVVVDLPALESIAVGVELGRRGCCVVPMFNTMSGTGGEVLDTAGIARALLGAAGELPEQPSGPPVFLIDSERRGAKPGHPRVGDFDNRWFVFASDFPSAELLESAGVKRLIVLTRAGEIEDDLADALAKYSALQPLLVNPLDGASRPVPGTRPAIFRAVASFARALQRNASGSFGRRVVSHG